MEWLPYELHPGIPPEGIPRERVIPAAYRQQVETGLNQMASAAGLRLEPHDRLINSRRALQAAEFARQQDRFEAMHRELFRAYWGEGRDLSDMSVLRVVAERAGVDADAMAVAVEAETYGPELDTRRAEAEELMISGIPAHIVADRYLVMGAQPYDLFERLMARLAVPKRA